MKGISKSFWIKSAFVSLFVIFSSISAVGTVFTAVCADKGYLRIDADYSNILASRGRISGRYAFLEWLFNSRYFIIAATVVAILLTIASFIILMCMAGHNSKHDGIYLNAVDRIPLDVYTALSAVAGFGVFGLLAMGINADFELIMAATYTVFSIVAELIVLAWCMSVASRIKAGNMLKNTVIYRFLIFIGKLFGKIADALRYALENINVIGKNIAIFALYTVINTALIMLSSFGHGRLSMLWLYLNAAVLVVICIISVNEKKILNSAEMMAAGNLNYKIDTGKMIGPMRRHAENLNNINIGITHAVDEKLKQERFKTELITNVSHDIKTPLTSVINYADLINREECENENIKKYSEALERAATRLKKVTEDIIEASKAATGNIKANIEQIDITELLNQSVAEYSDKLSASNLQAVVSGPEISVMTDGKLMWRVFDNLLNNVCKYSQENTRVYIDVSEDDSYVYVMFKNISRDILNIKPDELMERFVRGDSSRNSEGSGLGLSIARSLTEICGGVFKIEIDGDMFKAIIKLKK